MSRDTLEATISELVDVIAPGGVSVVTGVTQVYPFEPALVQMAKPTAITVDDGGMTDIAYVINVRVYQSTDVDGKAAAENMRAVYQQLDELLTPYWGPTEWVKEFDRDIGALVATCRIEVGREDGLLRLGGGL